MAEYPDWPDKNDGLRGRARAGVHVVDWVALRMITVLILAT